MKKIVWISVCLFFVLGCVHAQGWSTRVYGNYYKSDCFGLDLGIGGVKYVEGAELSLGLRYLHNFTAYVGWDVIGVQGLGNTSDFTASFIVQGMTGLRTYSPRFYKDMSSYANFRVGYGYGTDIEEGGFCYELGIGINLTRTLYAGYGYNCQNFAFDGFKIKQHYHAFRFGFNF